MGKLGVTTTYGDIEHLTVGEALERSAPQREQARLRREVPETPAKIIGASRPMRERSPASSRRAAARRSASRVLR